MRKEKALLLSQISKMTENSQGWIIIGYNRLNAQAMARLRGELASCGSEIEVVKTRILQKWAAQRAVPLPKVGGSIALLIASDLLAGAKALDSFDSNGGQIQIFGGEGMGQLFSGEEVEALAKLPSFAELQGELVSMLASPLSCLIAALRGTFTGIVDCLRWKEENYE